MTNLRRWWPVSVLLVIAIVVQKAIVESRYDVSGHAGEHLQSASVMFPAFVIVTILLCVTPPARRQPLVLGACALWLLGTVLVLIGNLRVVDTLVDAGLADVPTSQLVTTDTLESAHEVANLAPWLCVLSVLGLCAVMWRYRHISARVAVGAAVLSVIFPPWIFPGAGVLVIIIARCIAFQREERYATRRPAAPSMTKISS